MASTHNRNTSKTIAFEAAIRLDTLVRQDALDPYSRAILESAHSFLQEQDFMKTRRSDTKPDQFSARQLESLQ